MQQLYSGTFVLQIYSGTFVLAMMLYYRTVNVQNEDFF